MISIQNAGIFPHIVKKKQKQKLNSIVLIGFQLILSPFRVKY